MLNYDDFQKSPNKLWKLVCTTNPEDTKKLNIGRPITAIKPYTQFERATEILGPSGLGWGWEVVRVEYTQTNDVAVLIRFWHGTKENSFEQWGQCSLYLDKAETKKDSDCYKKATTDGVTKCLSYLGFNADIFLGLFEDVKYVAEMEALHSVPSSPPPKIVSDDPPLDASEATEVDQTWADWVGDHIKGFSDYTDIEDLAKWWEMNQPSMEAVQAHDPKLLQKLKTALKARKEALENG